MAALARLLAQVGPEVIFMWTGTISRVEGGRVYADIARARGYEVECLVVLPLSGVPVAPLTRGQRVMVAEYDRPDVYAIVGLIG